MGKRKVNPNALCGIYKIINPLGEVYIGYSKDIENRFDQYRNYKTRTQPKIYNSLIEYGWETHEFSIMELCDFDELCKRERYWQRLL